MRILLVADGRSPTARHWIAGLLSRGHEICLVSSYPLGANDKIEAIGTGRLTTCTLPIAFSNWVASPSAPGNSSRPGASRFHPRRLVRRFREIFLKGRYVLGPWSVRASASRYQEILRAFQPNLVHALRIPYEGMLASYTPPGLPLLVSIWGNDLTLHAHGSPWMRSATRHCLQRTQGLLADAQRDLRLAAQWGLRPSTPTLEVPGSGGIRVEEIAMQTGGVEDLLDLAPNDPRPLILNPRGLRPGSVRTDTFFQSIPLILEQAPSALFACPAMAGQPEALRWVETLNLAAAVQLLPPLPQPRLWDLFHRAQVFVSPSEHDGTPNSLLEGMAAGCFPIAGEIESVREWITPGQNGLLIDPADPQDLAEAVLRALRQPELRKQAAEANRMLVTERAETSRVLDRVEAFYRQFCP